MNKLKHITPIVIISLLLFVGIADRAFATQQTHSFDPSTQHYEYYPSSLNLWGADATGFAVLRAATNDIDAAVIRAWLAMLISAQAMGKKVIVTYDDTNGKIISVYGPK